MPVVLAASKSSRRTSAHLWKIGSPAHLPADHVRAGVARRRSNLADRYDAQIEELFRRGLNPFRDAAGRPRPHDLGDYICIEQVTGRHRCHRIFLVLSRFRFRSSTSPPVGADWKNSSSESGCHAFSAAPSKSSAATITTPSAGPSAN